jgi:hypothetical protein
MFSVIVTSPPVESVSPCSSRPITNPSRAAMRKSSCCRVRSEYAVRPPNHFIGKTPATMDGRGPKCVVLTGSLSGSSLLTLNVCMPNTLAVKMKVGFWT